MRIGIRGHDLASGGLDGLLSDLKRTGISTIQLVGYKSFPDISYKPGGITSEKASALSSVLNENDITVSLIGAYFNPVHSNKEKVAASKEIFKEYLMYSNDLGCNIVGSETGSFNDDKWTYHPLNRTDEARKAVVETFSELCSYAEDHDAYVGIEGAAGHVLYDVKTLKTACDEINKDNLKIIFDIYNFLDESNSTDYLNILDAGLDTFGQKIHCFHIKDCYIRQNEKPVQCPVGKGDLDFIEIFTRIKRHNENALLILEGTTGSDIDYAVDFINKQWNMVKKI